MAQFYGTEQEFLHYKSLVMEHILIISAIKTVFIGQNKTRNGRVTMKTYFLGYIADGFLLGFSLAILLGPIFVVLIDTSMRYGARAGLFVGSGIWVSDLIFIMITYFFVHEVSNLIKDDIIQSWVGIVGGLFLIAMGLMKIIRRNSFQTLHKFSDSLRKWSYFGKGFIINTFNPFTFVFWFGVIGAKFFQHQDKSSWVLVTCATILVVIMATDSAKVLGAKWISKRLNDRFIPKINVIAGILLITGGIVLFMRQWLA